MPTDNVTDSLKSTTQTSYYRIFIAAVVLGPAFVIGYIALANAVLPTADAEAFKAPVIAIWGTVAGSFSVGTVAGGLLRTRGKINTQQALAVAEATREPQEAPDDDGTPSE
ncbi:MAG TPA: hypothetical protein VF719_01515 [Abditibacteriaceae bacterium]|jgi:uncharacterized membrane protein YozB (DUF420 family)